MAAQQRFELGKGPRLLGADGISVHFKYLADFAAVVPAEDVHRNNGTLFVRQRFKGAFEFEGLFPAADGQVFGVLQGGIVPLGRVLFELALAFGREDLEHPGLKGFF